MDVFNPDTFVFALFIGMKMRRISGDIMPSAGKPAGVVFGKLLKTAVVVGDAACGHKCDFHIIGVSLAYAGLIYIQNSVEVCACGEFFSRVAGY